MKINIIRRFSQVIIIALFVASNFFGFKILQGDLSSSIVFNKIPLSDPFAVIQLLLAGFSIGLSALIGALIIAMFYSIIAPRVFCSWVCPVNIITDFSYFVRTKLGFFKNKKILFISSKVRYILLVIALVLSLALGFPMFENISFVGIIQRGLIFGETAWIGVAVVIFAIDTFICERAICSHICPLGAFYALISKFSLYKIEHFVQKCTKCMECKLVCPEVQVLKLIGKNSGFVNNSECISCGRCIDACEYDALKFNIRNLRRGE